MGEKQRDSASSSATTGSFICEFFTIASSIIMIGVCVYVCMYRYTPCLALYIDGYCVCHTQNISIPGRRYRFAFRPDPQNCRKAFRLESFPSAGCLHLQQPSNGALPACRDDLFQSPHGCLVDGPIQESFGKMAGQHGICRFSGCDAKLVDTPDCV